ncbi:MAG: response regulator [Oxalobacteraceae bacterium]|nr:MAG: response regulator [Oxalobacteraceae bacterium]
MDGRPLENRRILVVEDEFFMADELRQKLEAAGALVIGPAPSVERALALIKDEITIDAALLDVNLGGNMSYPVAEALIVRSVPFIFTSGYDESVFSEHYALMPRCQKPTEFSLIIGELVTLLPE